MAPPRDEAELCDGSSLLVRTGTVTETMDEILKALEDMGSPDAIPYVKGTAGGLIFRGLASAKVFPLVDEAYGLAYQLRRSYPSCCFYASAYRLDNDTKEGRYRLRGYPIVCFPSRPAEWDIAELEQIGTYSKIGESSVAATDVAAGLKELYRVAPFKITFADAAGVHGVFDVRLSPATAKVVAQHLVELSPLFLADVPSIEAVPEIVMREGAFHLIWN